MGVFSPNLRSALRFNVSIHRSDLIPLIGLSIFHSYFRNWSFFSHSVMPVNWKLYEQDIIRWYLDDDKTAKETVKWLNDTHHLTVT